jgi:cystathionine beta-lyase
MKCGSPGSRFLFLPIVHSALNGPGATIARMTASKLDPITRLIHHPYEPPAGFEAPQPGIFKASTVIFSSVAAMRSRDWKNKAGYTYGLHGTPTTFLLEERLCALEGGAHCLLAPSGLAAIATVSLGLLKAGDEVLLPDNAYGPNKALAEGELAAWGITHRLYDPMHPQDLADKISARTRLVWLEAPGSVTMEFPDLCAQVRLCRERGVTTALDNTWGAGLAFSPFDVDAGLGVDISVQALTKYPSGGGDVLMGSVITRDEALHLKLKLSHMRLGTGVGANDAETVLRSLPSIALRYRAHRIRQRGNWPLVRKAAPVCPGAASGIAPIAGPRALATPVWRPNLRPCLGSGCWLVQRDRGPNLLVSTGGRLLRRTGTVQAGLQLGGADQSGGSL